MAHTSDPELSDPLLSAHEIEELKTRGDIYEPQQEGFYRLYRPEIH